MTDSSDGDEIGTAGAGALGACAAGPLGYPDCGPEAYLGCGLDGCPDGGPDGYIGGCRDGVGGWTWGRDVGGVGRDGPGRAASGTDVVCGGVPTDP